MATDTSDPAVSWRWRVACQPQPADPPMQRRSPRIQQPICISLTRSGTYRAPQQQLCAACSRGVPVLPWACGLPGHSRLHRSPPLVQEWTKISNPNSQGIVKKHRSGQLPESPPDNQTIQLQMAIVSWQPGPNRVLEVPTQVTSYLCPSHHLPVSIHPRSSAMRCPQGFSHPGIPCGRTSRPPSCLLPGPPLPTKHPTTTQTYFIP